LAGFQVIISGRFWVIAEVRVGHPQKHLRPYPFVTLLPMIGQRPTVYCLVLYAVLTT